MKAQVRGAMLGIPGFCWYGYLMPDLGDEQLTAFIQTQLTHSAREDFRAEARRRHLTPSALLRILVMELLEKREAKV
jgi:hypothetical protein